MKQLMNDQMYLLYEGTILIQYAMMNSNVNDMKLYDDNGQGNDESVIQFIIESFSVLNGETDCVSCPFKHTQE